MKNTSKNLLLQKLLQKSSQKLEHYAKNCYQYSRLEKKWDKVFLTAFANELKECGYQQECNAILEQFQRNCVLQTAHHITPTNGPTFSAIDLLCLLGLEEKFYLVGAFSGVAFSNTAFSGSLCYCDLPLKEVIQKNSSIYRTLQKESTNRKRDIQPQNLPKYEQKIRLVSSSYKDDLIYGSDFKKYRLEIWDGFTEKALLFFPSPGKRESVLNWNLRCCVNLQREVFQKKEIIYFDICRLVKNYLLVKLAEKNSPLLEALLMLQQKIPHIPFFYTCRRGKKSWKVQPINSRDFMADGEENFFLQFLQKDYCPSSFLVFLVIAFFLGVRVLGSFQQIIYLPQYEQLIKAILPSSLAGEFFLKHQWEDTFTSGRLVLENGLFYPMDYVFTHRSLEIKRFQNQPLSWLWNHRQF